MSDLPRKQQDYYDQLRKAIQTGDEGMYSALVGNKNPLAIREDLANALGQHINDNYDNPLNIFKNKQAAEQIPVEYGKLPEGVAGKFTKTGSILMPTNNGIISNKNTGVLTHEIDHALDNQRGFISDVINPNVIKQLGSEAADSAFANHHSRGFFEKGALESLLNNKKLAANAGLMLKGAGALGIGATAIGAGQKAMAGDVPGATVDAADTASYAVPYLGEARMVGDLAMGTLGDEPTDPVSLKGSVFENDPDRIERFNKTLKILGK